MRKDAGEPGAKNAAQIQIQPSGVKVSIDIKSHQVKERPESQPEEYSQQNEEESKFLIRKCDDDFLQFAFQSRAFDFALRFLVKNDGDQQHQCDRNRGRDKNV